MRSRLQERVVEEVGKLKRLKRATTIVQTTLDAAEAMMNMQQPAHAQRLLAKGIKQAVRYETFSHLELIEELRGRLPAFLKGDKAASRNWPKIDLDLDALTMAQRDYDANKSLLKTAMALKQGGLEGIGAKATDLQARLAVINTQIHSRSNLMLCRSHWVCAFFLDGAPACEQFVDWAIAAGDRQQWLWDENDAFAVLEAAYYTKANILSMSLAFEDALAVLGRFEEKSIAARRFQLPKLTGIRRLIAVRHLLQDKHTKAIKRGLRGVLAEIGSGDMIDYHSFSICSRVISHCLYAHELEMALPWLELLRAAKPYRLPVTYAFNAYMLELSYWLVADDPGKMDNCLRRLVDYSGKPGTDPKLANVLVTGFRSLAKAPSSKDAVWIRFILALKELTEDSGYRRYFEIFDLGAFLSAYHEK